MKDILHIPKWIDDIKAPTISDNMSLTDDWDAQVDEILQIGLSKKPSFRGRTIPLDQCKRHSNPQPKFSSHSWKVSPTKPHFKVREPEAWLFLCVSVCPDLINVDSWLYSFMSKQDCYFKTTKILVVKGLFGGNGLGIYPEQKKHPQKLCWHATILTSCRSTLTWKHNRDSSLTVVPYHQKQTNTQAHAGHSVTRQETKSFTKPNPPRKLIRYVRIRRKLFILGSWN